MIDIPLGKTLVMVESNNCYECFFYDIILFGNFCTFPKKDKKCGERKDGKNVIYKLIDYPVEEKK